MNFEAKANVILTFEDTNQEIYDAEISADLPNDFANQKDIEKFEIDVIENILSQSKNNHDKLVKISLMYDGSNLTEETEKYYDYLCRNRAKYYFQPNQRDDYEQAIVDRLGIASKTQDF